jgi:hypothetical protein
MNDLVASTPTFLIVRARDLVVLAVRWKDCEIRTDAHGTPVLVPIGTAATVTLTFPPQAILEQTTSLSAFTSAAKVHCDSWLSGTSELVFRLSQGKAITLTAAGILQALHAVDPSSVIELPWGLQLKPLPQTSGAAVVSDHPGALIPIPGSDVVGLWHTRLRATDGTVTDARLSIQTAVAAPDPNVANDLLFQTPPLFGFREFIRRNGPTKPPRATRLELTALGGSLSCAVNWPDSSWGHTAKLGRDENVQTTVLGRLWPFGHRVVYEVFIRRDSLIVQTGARPGKVTCLKARRVLKILEPVRTGMRAATFPFDEVEIVGREFFINDSGGPPSQQLFIPQVGSEPLRIPIRFRSVTTDIGFVIPVIFVADGLQPTNSLVSTWKAFAKVDIAAVKLDMIGAADQRPGDVQEVYSLTLNGVADGAGFRPDLDKFEVVLPALRALLPGEVHNRRRTLVYVRAGVASIPNVLLRFDPPVDVDFTKNADRSGGLVSPKFTANGISRELGPVPTAVLNPLLNPHDLAAAFNTVFAGATLFGFPLASLVATAVTPKPGPPTILQQQVNGSTTVKFNWTGIKLRPYGPFRPRTEGSSPQLELDVVSRPPTLAEVERLEGPQATCTLSDFKLALPVDKPLLTLSFAHVKFTQRPDVPMKLDLDTPDIQFIGELKLLEKLQTEVMKVLGKSGPNIRVSTSEIIVSYQLRIPDAPAGYFVMRNIAVLTEVHVPFAEKPVRVIVGFASREQPFGLTVSGFGGGGYLALEIAGDTVSKLELSLEFGAMVALNFVIAKAEVHALGGVRFVSEATAGTVLEAYIRIGGSVQLLGLVTISVELRVSLRYSDSPPPPKLAGEASIVIELDLTLFSETVTVSSGTYVLIGGNSPLLSPDSIRPPEALEAAQREAWDNYWRAFA